MSLLQRDAPRDAFAELSCFRTEFYACLTQRPDALFELSDALLCADGPVRTLVKLSLAPEYRRGHGALCTALRRRGAEVGGQNPAGLPAGPGPQRTDGQGHDLPLSNSGRGAAVCGDEFDRLGGTALQGELRGDAAHGRREPAALA